MSAHGDETSNRGLTGKVTKVEALDIGGIDSGYRVTASDKDSPFGWEIEFYSPTTVTPGVKVSFTLDIGTAEEARPPRTFVLGVTRAKAVEWCRANGIGPESPRTHILSATGGVRGVMVHKEDRVVFVGDVTSRTDYDHIMAALRPCLMGVGEDHIESVAEVTA